MLLSFPTDADREKRSKLDELLQGRPWAVALVNGKVPGCKLPPHLASHSERWRWKLRLDHTVRVTSRGVSGTRYFKDEGWHRFEVPWAAVYVLSVPEAEPFVWRDDVPEEYDEAG